PPGKKHSLGRRGVSRAHGARVCFGPRTRRHGTMRATPVEQGIVARLLARPDEVMLEHGAGGELLVAKLRVVISVLILALPLIAGLGRADASQVLLGLAGAVAINIVAQVWLALARSHRRHGWLPYATGTWDVSATSGVLLMLAREDP